MENSENLYFLIGVARSGKSTFAKDWQNMGNSRVVVNADSIRLALSGDRWNYLTEPFVHAIKNTMIRTLLNQGYKVLVDGTHTTIKSISELFDIDNNARYYIINTPKEECIRRAIESKQSDLIPVIERMSNQLELLTIDKIEEARQNSIKNKNSQRIV